MLRLLKLNRFTSLKPRAFVTGTAQGAIQNATESGPKPRESQEYIERQLERDFARFEENCQRMERVVERDLVRTFEKFTKAAEDLEKKNLGTLSGVLIRCCGRIMMDTPPKTREILADQVWQYIKEKGIPLDTSIYNSLIKILNENRTFVDPQKLLDEMKAANLVPDRVTYQRLIHQYCIQGNVTSAASLLEVMKEKSMILNEAIFASLIIGYSMQENPPSLDEMFELMRTNGIEPGSQSYSAAILSQVRSMERDAARATEELNKLYQVIRDQDIQFNVYEVGELLAELSLLKELEVANKMIDLLIKSTPTTMNTRQRLFAMLIDCGQLEEASDQFWSREPTDRARNSGRFGNFYIKMLASSKKVPVDHAIAECSRMIASNVNLNAFHQLYYVAASVGNLGLVRGALEKIGETEPLKCHYYWPLLAQAKDNNELLSVLKNDLHPKMNPSGLLETLTDWVWPKFAENPNELLEYNKNELKYDNGLLIASYLDYCVSQNKILEAVKFVSELPAQDSTEHHEHQEHAKNEDDIEQEDVYEPMISQNQSLRFDRSNLIGRLLAQISEQTKDTAVVDKAFALCKVPGLKITSKMLMPVIKARLDHSEDFNAALDCFLDIADKYGLTPCKLDLMIHCLEKKDSDSLQKIMDVSSKIYGETNSLFDLACACIRCGKMKQANKVLSSPGFRVHSSRVYNACKSLFRLQKIDVLENFVFATRDLPEVNHDYLYEILLDAYDRTGNQKKALDLWNRMQEDDFQPSKRILLHIARVLENANIPVPFQIPRNYSSVLG